VGSNNTKIMHRARLALIVEKTCSGGRGERTKGWDSFPTAHPELLVFARDGWETKDRERGKGKKRQLKGKSLTSDALGRLHNANTVWEASSVPGVYTVIGGRSQQL